MTGPLYCVDTSSLIHAADRAYPIDVFGSFWERFDGLISDGRVIAPREVLKEISRQHDELHDWCKGRNGMFVPTSVELQRELVMVNQQFPTLVDLKKNRGLADPWVVALARLTGATAVVLTQEFSKPTKPRIPDACRALGIRTMNLLDLIRQEKWTWNT